VDVVGEKWSKSGKTCRLLGKFLYDHRPYTLQYQSYVALPDRAALQQMQRFVPEKRQLLVVLRIKVSELLEFLRLEAGRCQRFVETPQMMLSSRHPELADLLKQCLRDPHKAVQGAKRASR
jgi:hypothetical protein